MKQCGLRRDTIDKFYTKSSVVDICMDMFNKSINTAKSDIVIEPSAGNGSFIQRIKQLGVAYEFYDLVPENSEIVERDYLKYANCENNSYHVIGNPPFGRQSSTAIKFIKKSAEYAKSISFILPKSFKKPSMQRHFPLTYHLINEIDLPENSFLLNDKEYNVPCVFQIWIKQSYNRAIIEKLVPEKFEFVKKQDNPDIAIRRVGVNAGKIFTNIDKSEQSHYFIKFINGNIEENIKALEKNVFEFNNTVGPRSLSKQEIIHEFEKNLN